VGILFKRSTQKEGIPIDTILNFFVMVDDLAYKRLGQKRKKGFFGIPMGPQLGEEDIKRVLYSLTNEEIDFMIHSCIELTEKGTPMQHYRRQLEQIKRLQRDLALAQLNS
jgi:hypothetical protein